MNVISNMPLDLRSKPICLGKSGYTFGTAAIDALRGRRHMTTMSVAEYARDCAAQGLRGDYSV
ncbi:hypothetical protein EOA30_36905, partial [Mesorhizobium sp. M8A.F.Ca.ET.059.01.1.1]